MRTSRRASILVALAASGCGGSSPGGFPTAPGSVNGSSTLQLTPVATGLQNPVHLTAPAGDARLFVVEQAGTIRIIRDAAVEAQPFLDITDRVSGGGERGLLSLAFHPDYEQNGFLYVDYTGANGETRVERYRISTDPDRADETSAALVIEIAQPFSNHNGGHILFGPDGMLYVATGDGGDAGDPDGNGQDRTTLLGALLRLDVDGGSPYAVPDDNPFVGSPPFRAEIWAWGLRNPWRIAFDPAEGRLYVADVGQNRIEEVNVVSASEPGLNFGWNVMEGSECFESAECDRTGKTLPALEYDHSLGCSVTGGLVYRGASLPAVAGHYFFSDYCRGWLRSFRYTGGEVTDLREWDVRDIGRVVSFGRDGAGELYILSTEGVVYRVEPDA
jgi:glucose/arabinose dehydrogenase